MPVDKAVRLLELIEGPRDLVEPRTDKDPLPGAVGWPADDDHAKVARQVSEAAKGLLDDDIARHLADTYGMSALDIAKLKDVGAVK